MTATVSIVTQQRDNAVLVPNSAISNGTVSVLRNGSPVPVQVESGSTDGLNTEIISGVEPGDQVIINSPTSTNLERTPQATPTSDNSRPPAA